MNLSEYKKHFLDQLKSEYPFTEAESFFNLLAEEYLGMKRLEVALNPKMELQEPQKEKFGKALLRLSKHEPIQYILGKTEFYGMEFMVNPSVLIPRPETEELVEWILSSEFRVQSSEFRILDIGTGSGCIAVALAKNLFRAKIMALDVSKKALETAKKNAETNQVDVEFIQGNILKMGSLPKKFDVIVSNPPYIRELEKKQMQRNVLEHEPETALYVKDEDPLLFYRKIANLAKGNLNENGAVYMEINQYLGKETEAVFQDREFSTEIKKDLFGQERMLKATPIFTKIL